MLKMPIVIINFKAYKNAVGRQAIELARECEKTSRRFGVTIAVAVQASDIWPVSDKASIPVLAQHIDPVEPGAKTGSVLAEAVKKAGAAGTFLNHSEKRLSFNELKKANKLAKRAGLLTFIFAATPAAAKKIARLNPKPDCILIEPPELVGGKVSVSQARPQVITATTKAIRKIPVICGAGIKTGDDVRKALKLGAAGVAVASGVTKAKDPEKVLRELAIALLR